MKTRQLYRLREQLASMVKSGETYDKAAREYGVVDCNGKPDRGMAHRIVHGYDPAKAETRKRLGLSKNRKRLLGRKSIDEHLAGDRIQDMPPPLLNWAFVNRQEIK